jgi:hypothetical protein
MMYDIADDVPDATTDNYSYEGMSLRFQEPERPQKPSGIGKKPRQQRAEQGTQGAMSSPTHFLW